jgi:UDP-N-acetylglucosamine acyltransferase
MAYHTAIRVGLQPARAMETAMIHPTAIVDSAAELADDVTVGAYAVIEGPVRAESGVRIHSHANISGASTLRSGCEVHPFAAVGGPPQDLKYDGAESFVEIGERTILREYVSVHRGTEAGSRTLVGADCLLMAKAHVGHNCTIENGVILTNAVECGGHSEIGAHAVFGGGAMTHQFARVGRRAMVAGMARVRHDVPPFVSCDTEGALSKLNTIGLRREGLQRDAMAALKEAFKALWRSGRPFQLALAELRTKDHHPIVEELLTFVSTPSKLGIAGPRRHAAGG